MSVAELPAHTHGPGNLATGGASWNTDNTVYAAGGGSNFVYISWGGAGVGGDAAKRNDIAHTHAVTSGLTGSTGSGSAHNIMQPYQVVNYIIKY